MRESGRVEELLEEVRDSLIRQGEVTVTQDDLIDQVGRIIDYNRDQDRSIRRYRRWMFLFAFLTAVLTGATVVLAVLHNNNTRDSSQEIVMSKPLDRQPEKQSPPNIMDHSNIMDRLKNEPRTGQRFKLLEANLDSVPSSLSLNQLESYIQLFQPESYRLRVVRLLRHRLRANYSNNELEAFKQLFNSYKQPEAEGLLPNGKR